MDKQAAVDATTHVVEATYDTLETAFDTVEAVPAVVKNNPVVLVSVAVISMAVGAGAATYIVNRRLKLKYEALSEQEIQEARAFYLRKSTDTTNEEDVVEENESEGSDEDLGVSTQAEMVKEAADILRTQEYVPYDKASVGASVEEVVEVKASIKRNVFEDHGSSDQDDVFDPDGLEDAKREQGRPYIVDVETYFENDDEWSQTALDWYEGDSVLADEQDNPINNLGVIGGVENLRFGYGSGDDNVVFIANPTIKAFYEVTRSGGKYTVEVLGEQEMRHSDRRGGSTRPYKFRSEED